MTGTGDPSIESLLAAARAQFVAGLPSRIGVLDAAIAKSAWEDARRAAHKLRGAAATYGLVELGQSAGAIEQIVLDAHDRCGAEERARVLELLGECHAQVARATEAP